MLVHGLLAEVLTKAPMLVSSQPNYVTKMVFPLETLAAVTVLTAIFHIGLALAVLLLINAAVGTGPAWPQLSVPLLLAPFCLLLLGLAWIVSALGVYIRDMNQLMGPLVTVLMFLGPVFYPRAALPAGLQPWLALNPITVPIEQFRKVLFDGQWPDWPSLWQYSLVSIIVCMLGFWVFSTLRKGFADVL
ncbi:MAG TPA: ABC transporter permease [Steroidobacteraceae bacterium]|nr:ABC transporter permease [Steroidobacteraceae bacterium]